MLLLTNFGLQAQLVINEIFPAPLNNQPEWIELYNANEKEFIFDGGYINDAVGSKKIPAFSLAARNYIILTKDSTEFLTNWTKSDSCLIMQISLPTFNNDWDKLMLRDRDSILTDSMYYNLNKGFKGISLERINPYLFDMDSNNWLGSISPDSSTPGSWNSVSIPIKDISVNLIGLSKDSLKLEISNNSSFEMEIDEFLLFFDLNNDGLFSENELCSGSYNISMEKNEKRYICYELSTQNSLLNLFGNIYFKAEAKIQNDNKNNNAIISYYYKDINQHSVVINEVMYDTDEKQAEYLELFNSSTNNIILNDVIIHDSYKITGYDTIKIKRPCNLLFAGDYLVIVRDSAFFKQFPDMINSKKLIFINSKIDFNLYEDDIVVSTPSAKVLDSLHYRNIWHNVDFISTKGKSLEKINPYLITNSFSSWTTSLDFQGGTPGKENSVFQVQRLEGELTAEPNPFSPDGNNKDRFCIISYELPFDNASLYLKLCDQNGNVIRNLAVNYKSDKTGSFTWDGRNDEGFKMDIGPYILILTAKNQYDKEYDKKILIVVAE